jgi:polygalacturonase
VVLPAGRWLSFSIRLLSGVTLRLDEGCVLEAADPARHAGAYDPPSPTRSTSTRTSATATGATA